MELTEKQMYEVNGGASWAVLSGIAAALVYIMGLISGYTNPGRCHN